MSQTAESTARAGAMLPKEPEEIPGGQRRPPASYPAILLDDRNRPTRSKERTAIEKDSHNGKARPLRCRWLMLFLLSLDICASYLPYYTFVPILSQSMQVYQVDESDLNVLCILYALVYVPCAFLTGPMISACGCRWAFILAMVLTTSGCAVRCGPTFFAQITGLDFDLEGYRLVEASPVPAASTSLSFSWLVVGQAVSALGQPFLVNATSQVGAEWFPPRERPAAAMISNLMNFVGASLSFVLPPIIVARHSPSLRDTREQISLLLRLQLGISFVCLFLTFVLYQPTPPAPVLHSRKTPMSFLTEVRGFLSLRDFWLVNFQFSMYVTVCHAFDAVEGALLESHGYNAALSSWTAVACSTTSVLSTAVEAFFITDPTAYKRALIIVNMVLAASQIIGFVCLHWQLHEAGFILAVAIMGLSTPGWGCSCELGSEVCFPAREATVSSLLEACSNLLGVAGIIVIQRLMDAGLGSGVMLIMAWSAALGGGAMLGLSGRLRRSEAEEKEVELEAMTEVLTDMVSFNKEPSPSGTRRVFVWASTLRMRLRLGFWPLREMTKAEATTVVRPQSPGQTSPSGENTDRNLPEDAHPLI